MANIAIVCDREFFSPFDQRVYKEVVSMKKAGHNIEILTPHISSEIRDLEGIKVRCFSKNGPPGIVAYRLIKQALRGNYDLFYCHEFDPLVYSLVLKTLTRKPVIWDCHEYLIPMKKELQGNLAAVLTEIMMKIAAPKVDHIVTVDNLLGRQLAKFGKVTVIPNYPTLFDFPEKKNTPKKEPNLLYVGGLTRKRGVKVMLEAFNLVRKEFDISMTIVGGFYDSELEKWAYDFDEKNGLNINWLGWVNYRDLAPIFSEASIGLCLLQNQKRYRNAISTKIFEYLIMGIPVITSKGPLLENLVKNGNCGICIDSENIELISKKIIEMIKDKNYANMGESGKKFTRSKFIWEARENNLLNIIKQYTNSN
ncbi:MAG: glycosyltransferase family 4 protein [archaeon]|nr:glycosyltransferase family 4 protein [archaeon]